MVHSVLFLVFLCLVSLFPGVLAPVSAQDAPLPSTVSTGEEPAVSPGEEPAVSPGEEPAVSPALANALRARFDQGYLLENEGKYAEARDIYDGILAQVPTARRSLLEAGRCSAALFEFHRASDDLERLHSLEPTLPSALELLVEVNQSLGYDVKVEKYRKALKALHDQDPGSDFGASLIFVRERIRQEASLVVVTEAFHYDQAPYVVWRAQRLDSATKKITSRIALKYDPDATAAIRAKDSRLAGVEEFILMEESIKDGRIEAVNAYKQYFSLPQYRSFRELALLIMNGQAPPPLYSQSLDVAVPELMDGNAP